MNVTIRSRHVSLTPEDEAELRHRVRRAFERVHLLIEAIDITIADTNGPKGGADKQCRLRVRGRSIPRIVIESVGVDVLSTVAVAADRAQHVVLRKAARRRRFVPAFAF